MILGGKKSSIFCLLAGVIILVVTSSPMVASQLAASLENQYPPKPIESSPNAKVIVVLGGVIRMPVKPRLEVELVESSDRILHAFRLFQAGKAPTIFISAGNILKIDDRESEAFYISRLLVEWGIPENVIAKAGYSRSTRENAMETHAYLDDSKLLDEPVLLVTSAIHMPRAVKTFEKSGINVIPSTTDIIAAGALVPDFINWLPSLGALNIFTKAWHEYLGLWAYHLRGWV